MGRYAIGRTLQFLGLLILPFAIASELVGNLVSVSRCSSRRAGPLSSTSGLWFRTARRERTPPRGRYAKCIFSGQYSRTIPNARAFSIIGDGNHALWYSICCCVGLMI